MSSPTMPLSQVTVRSGAGTAAKGRPPDRNAARERTERLGEGDQPFDELDSVQGHWTQVPGRGTQRQRLNTRLYASRLLGGRPCRIGSALFHVNSGGCGFSAIAALGESVI